MGADERGEDQHAARLRRPDEVIRAELAAVDAEMIELQAACRELAERRMRLAAELVAPAMGQYLADLRAAGYQADQVPEESAGGQ